VQPFMSIGGGGAGGGCHFRVWWALSYFRVRTVGFYVYFHAVFYIKVMHCELYSTLHTSTLVYHYPKRKGCLLIHDTDIT
jgi:hypothetical protein